jgi:hypothetical protein
MLLTSLDETGELAGNHTICACRDHAASAI